MRRSIGAATLLAVVTLVGACSTAATQAPTQAPATAAPATAAPASAAPASAAPASMTPASAAPATAAPASAAPAASIAAVPTSELVAPTKLTVCSDIPYAPQEFLDANGNPTGADIDIGAEIAKRLGLTEVVNNTVFDTIIEAIASPKCDIILSAMNITAPRVKAVDFIPYFQAGQSFVVSKGNPANITKTSDLCGKTVAVEAGTTEVDYLNGAGAYQGHGLSASCQAQGLKPITVSTFAKDSDAILALQSGHADAYFGDSPVAGYYVAQHPDQFQLSGLTVGVALEGIGVAKTNTQLRDAVQQALISMINDGTYLNILNKYGVASDAITAAVAAKINYLGH
jgi:polar amino acid transport system substrate-binding protein